MIWFSMKIKPIQNIKVHFHCIEFFSIVSMVVVPLVIEKCTGYYSIPMRSTMSNNPNTCMKLGHWTKHVTTISSLFDRVYENAACVPFSFAYIFMMVNGFTELNKIVCVFVCARERIAETTENGCIAVMKHEMHEK